jgi:glutathione S-transferase
VTVACALDYITRRMPEEDWRQYAPRLARWHDAFAARPSMTETQAPA